MYLSAHPVETAAGANFDVGCLSRHRLGPFVAHDFVVVPAAVVVVLAVVVVFVSVIVRH